MTRKLPLERAALFYGGALIAIALAFHFDQVAIGFGLIIGVLASFSLGRAILLGAFLGLMSVGGGSGRSRGRGCRSGSGSDGGGYDSDY